MNADLRMSNRQRNEWITAHTEQKDLSVLNSEFEHASPDVILKWSYEEFGTRVVMGTGFGSSGVVLMHYLSELGLQFRFLLSIPVSCLIRPTSSGRPSKEGFALRWSVYLPSSLCLARRTDLVRIYGKVNRTNAAISGKFFL